MGIYESSIVVVKVYGTNSNKVKTKVETENTPTQLRNVINKKICIKLFV